MKPPLSTPTIRRFTPAEQGSGAFDGGKITEIKPVPFPHEQGGARSFGPLFYWAWATAHGDGKIPMHPHQGFEILSYALEGEIGHTDSLGTESRVAKGGVQVMQTGSGVSHQEEMFGDRTDFFQIWFEPDLREAMKRPPTYAEFSDDDFPREGRNGSVVKSIIGGDGPITLVADVSLIDVEIEPGADFEYPLLYGRTLAVVAVEGAGKWEDEIPTPIEARDFFLLSDSETIRAIAGDKGLRLVILEFPREVSYPLYSGH